MTDSSGELLPLASEFPPATREQWLKLVEGALKGRPFDRLVAKTHDGLRIEPLSARAADAQPIAGRTAACWQVMQRIDHPDPAAANAEALHDLENGATGLTLVFAGAVGDYGFGIEASAAALARALDGVHLDAGIALELDLAPAAQLAGNDIAALVTARGLDPAATGIRFGFDPLGAMAHAGAGAPQWKDIAPTFASLIGGLAGQGFAGPFAAADGRVIHAAGGSEAQELAFVLAVAVAYLRALEAGGVPFDAARRMIFFRLAADADQFLTIAKFRALRKLWARVEEACGLAPRPAFVAAETAWRMMTRCDPYVNMLRTTVAAFAATVGGADAIAVLPFTAALGLPDRFARRVARNTQLVLAEESNLAKVADPAAGSGAVEELTDELGRAAWALFREIEKAGSAEAALASGLIQEKVAHVRAEREHAVAHRSDALTGTSEFPNLAEAPPPVLDALHPPPLAGEVASAASRRGSEALTFPTSAPRTPPPTPPHKGEGRSAPPPPLAGQEAFAPLPRMRLAEPFERLRDASDRVLAETGARPKVFLANLGTPADFLARATFAKNFFEAGGIEARTNDGFASPLPSGERATDLAALASAFAASGATLACLCSSDEVYAREAVDAAEALAAAGARLICLAGRPAERESLERAGVGAFIYAGCDAVETLARLHDSLAIGRSQEPNGSPKQAR